jgi:hypothetical protein
MRSSLGSFDCEKIRSLRCHFGLNEMVEIARVVDVRLINVDRIELFAE